MLNIGHFDYQVEIAGPDSRLEMFLQGCFKNCPNCFNQSLRSFSGGRHYSDMDLINDIKLNSPNRTLSIGGGEPFIQYTELSRFLALLRVNIPDIHVLIYTGYSFDDFEQIINLRHESIDFIRDNNLELLNHDLLTKVPNTIYSLAFHLSIIFKNIDMLVDGDFQVNNILPRKPMFFIGSSNQRVITFNDGTVKEKLSALDYYEKYDIIRRETNNV